MSQEPTPYNVSRTTISPPAPPPPPPIVDRAHLQRACDDAAAFLCALHPSDQVGWILYLLEILDAHYATLPFQSFDLLLTGLIDQIALRRAHHSW